jgi:hypothetical protein
MVRLNLSPIPVGRRGVISSFKLFLPVFATRRGRGEGVGALWGQPGFTYTSPLSFYDWPKFYLYPPIAVQYPLGPVCDWPEVIDCTMGTTPSPTTAPPCNCEPWQDCNQARIAFYIFPFFRVEMVFLFHKMINFAAFLQLQKKTHENRKKFLSYN